MTLMAIGKTPELWAAAAEQYGIIDWKTMLQHEDPLLQEYEKSLLGDPVRTPRSTSTTPRSPHPQRTRAPVGAAGRPTTSGCPRRRAEQVVAILKADGRTVDAHYYPNEGHGFVKR